MVSVDFVVKRAQLGSVVFQCATTYEPLIVMHRTSVFLHEPS